MKKLLLLVSTVLLTLSSQAQFGRTTNGYIGFTLGGSIPINDFANDKLYYGDYGSANPGPTFSINGAYFFTKNIGVTASAFTKEWKMENDLVLNIPLYKSSGFMVGAIATVPTGKVNLDARFLMGYAHTSRGNVVQQTPHFFPNPTTIELSEAEGTRLAFGAGLGCRVHIRKKFYALVNMDYYHTNAKMEKGNSILRQNIETISLSIGLGYRL
jgi:hypothetical protein